MGFLFAGDGNYRSHRRLLFQHCVSKRGGSAVRSICYALGCYHVGGFRKLNVVFVTKVVRTMRALADPCLGGLTCASLDSEQRWNWYSRTDNAHGSTIASAERCASNPRRVVICILITM